MLTHLVHAIFKPIGVTNFASQMFGGMILGMLWKVKGIRTIFFTADFGVETLETAALFGLCMFLFLMRVKMDLNVAFRTSRRAILVGIISILSPMLVALAVYQTYKEPHHTKTSLMELSYFSNFEDIKVNLSPYAMSMCVNGSTNFRFLLQYMSKQAFCIFTLGILVNATIIPILVKFLYNPNSRKYTAYQKRNIVHLKPDAELRILACIHRPEHVSALIDVLDITCPTKECPNVVYALHLVEPAGCDSPVSIAHKKNENVVGLSFQHILAFRQYEENNRGFVTVNAFTATSPPKLMHEDVCTMALNKQTSFILLPFHRKWSIDGSIEVENNVIRNLNCRVLDRAPCSVGILITRGVLDQRRKSFYSIGMLFLGGKDDREALTLAKRMARDPRVKLTVIHLITDEDGGNVMDWDMMLDAEILRDTKHSGVSNVCNRTYVEEVSNSGPQATRFIRSIANEYNLIIVGRRDGVDSAQTRGLSEWSEFPELGVIGDLLASTDLDSSASILVVQQHYVH
ncbi:cation/H+ exchanger 4 [Hibiscus trionum]|uniref:Cation/H+ exchanger 4 n=1 Tax=Hibiscus trionum TaxID=183268 RepID=A0A9W7HB89_HIBTR|nr:cation/H+ exchanger 4 [Hibiscus trionum]